MTDHGRCPEADQRRWPHVLTPAIVVVTLAITLVLAAPPGKASVLSAEEPVFVSRVETAPLATPVALPQDVVGTVLDRYGQGLSGVWVKVKSEGAWEATAATRGDGSFYFTLTAGRFSAILVDRVSQPAFFRVDGNTAIRIIFQEVATGATSTTTPAPTLSPTTPTMGPAPTSPPVRPRGTPTPSVTPLSGLAPTPTPGGSSPGLPGVDSWLATFIAGLGLGAAIFLGILIAMRRRR